MEEPTTLQAPCDHRGRYELRPNNLFGFVQCLECDGEVPLGTPLEAQIARLQQYEEKIKALLFK